MRIRDTLHSAIRSLRQSKARSVLTMLGIVIGISSVILLMSLGASAQALILNQVEGIGSHVIFVIPGATKGSRFSSPASVQGIVIKSLIKRDVDALTGLPFITHVAPEVRGQARVLYENNDVSATYEGTTPDFFSIRNFSVQEGSLFTRTDVDTLAHVALIGDSIAHTLFGSTDPVGKTIRIKNMLFTISGVLEKKGIGPFGVDQDSLVMIPVTVAQKQLLGIDYYNSLIMQAADGYDTHFVQDQVAASLRKNHSIMNPDKDDFTIRTQEDALALLGNITSVMTLFLTAIAFISLIVGGIGIMNIMLVSVSERTKEIGLRKAIGATNSDILQQFLVEAIILTFLGGCIGIAIGASLVGIIYEVASRISPAGWVFALPSHAMILAVSVSIATGIIFGLYPARKASLKSPIEALRYE